MTQAAPPEPIVRAARPRALVRIAQIALVAIVAFLLYETWRLAELAGGFEKQALDAQARAERLERELAARPATAPDDVPSELEAGAADAAPDVEAAPDLSDYTRVQLELHTTKEQLAALRELLEQRNAELAARARESEERAARNLEPMPTGVRICLAALQECLRTEGFYNQRFLRAASLDDDGLHEVELLDTSDDGLAVAFVTAGRMTATVDRAEGRFELRFFDGHRTVMGERAALPEDGFLVRFDDIDGRMFERRLPYLVQTEGAYPVEPDGATRPDTDVDPGTRRQWLSRIGRLLSGAKTQERWRATRLRGMDDGWFLTVELVGTDEKGLVQASAHCGRVAVEVDEKKGVVSLLLQDGILRREGGDSTITSEGYRMLLPGLTPKETIDAMLGMVVRR